MSKYTSFINIYLLNALILMRTPFFLGEWLQGNVVYPYFDRGIIALHSS